MAVRVLSRTPEGRQRRVWIAQTALAWGTLLALGYLGLTGGLNFATDLAYDNAAARAFLEGRGISSIHPPALVLANVPFTLLPFPFVSAIWLLLNILFLLVIGRWLGMSIRASLALAAWPPLFGLLVLGQYELSILFLVMAGWRAARAGRDYRAGALIGLAAVMKFYPGLFVVPFLVQRRYRLVASTCLVFLIGQALGALAVGGPIGLFHYYQTLAGLESSVILPLWGNASPYASLLHALRGADGIPPLVQAPELVWPITLALALLGLFALIRLHPEAAPVATLVALPNSVFYCAVLALPQMVYLWNRQERSNGAWRFALVGAFAASSLIMAMVNAILGLLVEGVGVHGPVVSTALLALSSVQSVGFIILLVLSLVAGLRGDSAPHLPLAATSGPSRHSQNATARVG